MRAALPRIAVAAAVAAVAGLGVGAAARSSGEPAPRGAVRLPDLAQAVPAQVSITRVRGPGGGVAERLGFRSAVENVGDGPLVVEGRRARVAEPEMRVDQHVARSGGGTSVVRGVGRLRYVEADDHEHWHLLGFDRYELRGLDGRRAVRDAKTGFCLGDRYVSTRFTRLPAAPRDPRYTSSCGLGDRDRLRLRQGISVGYGDDYAPQLEGQFLDVTAVPDGRWVLVHRADADRRLRERTRANNAASVLVRLARRADGTRAVSVLRRCPGTDRCPPR